MFRSSRNAVVPSDPVLRAALASQQRYHICCGVSAVRAAHVVGALHQVAAIATLFTAFLFGQLAGVLYVFPIALATLLLTGLLVYGLHHRRVCLVLIFLVYQALVVISIGCYIAFNVYKLAGLTSSQPSDVSDNDRNSFLDSRIQLMVAIAVDMVEFCCFRMVTLAYKEIKHELLNEANTSFPRPSPQQLDAEAAFENYRQLHQLPPPPPKYSLTVSSPPTPTSTDIEEITSTSAVNAEAGPSYVQCDVYDEVVLPPPADNIGAPPAYMEIELHQASEDEAKMDAANLDDDCGSTVSETPPSQENTHD